MQTDVCISWAVAVELQPADFESNWLLMESQSNSNFFREVDHGLAEVPLKVKVMVKPLNGPYKDWMFEAGSSQQADDDLEWLYCGIIYAYNVTHVNLFAPRSNGRGEGGRAFCIDSSSWTSGTNSSTVDQIEQEVLAKVMVWKSSSFPSPDMDTDWISINSDGYSDRVLCIRDGYARDDDGYRCDQGEFRVRGWTSLGQRVQRFRFRLNGLDPDSIPDMSALKVNIRQWDSLTNYVQVQVKALDGPNAEFIFPAIGQGHRNAYPESTYGGVIFGYSADSIRIFVPANDTGTMISIPENWGTADYNQVSNNVEIVVTVWSTTDDGLSKRSRLGVFSRLQTIGCPDKHSTKCAALCLADFNCIGISACQPYSLCERLDLDIVNKKLIKGVLGFRGEMLLQMLTRD
ncbi:hypothetical protein LSH36_1104g00007 [Paralvinella palmiformis]|uniref:Uncharacterized protein n=1 Tax=Paralvinella palmiformis TaxID=53620 RepID=A0AAD9IW84_9ANNE|nr:hypothetical protein LSH36_1104g00007 [Paralvinella palmiformis]